jgi:hypothetical protein
VGAIGEIAFFAAFWGYVYAGVDPRLIWHWQAPAFEWTREFLAAFLRRPGGPAEFLYTLTAQAFLSRWWGALVLTAEAWAITRLAAVCVRGSVLRFAPALALLFLTNRYYDRSPVALQLLIGLGGAAACIAPMGVPVLLAAVFYLGGPAILFCAPAAALVFAAREEKRTAPVAAAALVIAVLLPLTLPDARSWFGATEPGVLAARWGLYAVMAAAPLIRPLKGRVASAAALLALAGVAALGYRMNARDRQLAALDYFTVHEDWASALAVGERLPSADFSSLTRYEINLALHETGRLGDEMFRFPQTGSPLPSLLPNAFLPYAIRQADLCLRLGRVNDAERFGSEAAILGGADPRVYRLMADVNLVKGQTEVAAKFLRALGEPGAAESSPRIQALRRRMLRSDDVLAVWQRAGHPEGDVEQMLLNQLEQDPTNRTAFEFLMAARLAARDLAGVAALMPRLKDVNGGRRTPRHYQEAMAMYADNLGRLPAIDGFAIESETLNRMAVFKRIVQTGPTRDAAFQSAWESFRHSYFFYFAFGTGDYR